MYTAVQAGVLSALRIEHFYNFQKMKLLKSAINTQLKGHYNETVTFSSKKCSKIHKKAKCAYNNTVG